MKLSLPSRVALALVTVATLVFLYLPLAVVLRLSFNPAKSVAWPGFNGYTLDWWRKAWQAEGPKDALLNSCKVALVATFVALVLGTLAAMAMARFRFFGRNAVSFLMVLPISLPGIVTGIALQTTFSRTIDLGLFSFRVGFGFHSLVIAHATFCVVVAYNNVVARLRRSSPNLLEASADLGAHGSQTFRYITFPLMRSALLAGGILAFALSFDEIVVTTFTAGSGFLTLPQWILANYSRPQNVPLVNVMATFVMVVSIPMAYLAQRLSDGGTDA
ncbi:MAG: ABC transporter permease [Ilumatobacter sp.]|nr:ABC transporter permease [Ilumatobacter sp.]MCB0983611.1 ABC transporter permease [Ilumatobacter sp.]